MSDETKVKLKKWALRALVSLIPLILGGVGGNQLTPNKTVEVEKPIPVPVKIPDLSLIHI